MRLSGTKTGAINQYRGLGNQLWDLAGNRPSLDLPFSETKSLIDTTTGTNLIDFSRASSGTYVGSDGLIKTATTNYLLQSEDLTVAPWSTSGAVTISEDYTQGVPFEGAKVYKVIFSATNEALNQGFTYLDQEYAASIYIAGAQGDVIRFSGKTGQSAANYTLNGGWERLSQPFTATAGTVNFNINTAGLSAVTVYVAAPQLEQSSTVGEYIKTTSTINSAPRFDHDPTTGESLGLLVEEQRQNLLLRSEEFDDAAWLTSGSYTSITPNSTIAPDGTQTADTIVFSSGSGFFYQTVSVSASTSYTFSFFRKVTGLTKVAVYDATNAAWITQDASVTSTQYANGWERVSYTFTTPAGCTSARVYPERLGGGDRTIVFWGAQLEEGSFPTSYIPTEGTTVTRAADITSIEGNDFGTFNLLQYSEEFDQSYWAKTSASITPNTQKAPDNSLTADTLTFDGSTTALFLTRRVTLTGNTAGRTFTESVYIKGLVGGEQLQLGLAEYGGATSAAGISQLDITATTDWVRYDLTGSVAQNDRTSIEWRIRGRNGPAGSVYVWGAQLEESSTVTPYVKSDVTFSNRSSTATYYDYNGIIQTAAVDEARTNAFLPDGNGNFVSAGELLLEDAGTNLVTYSEEFDNASWNKIRSSISSNSIVAPDGTFSADNLTATDADAFIFQNVNVTASTQYIFSIYLKASTETNLSIRLLSSSYSSIAALNVVATGEWQRFNLSFNSNTNTLVRVTIGGASSFNSPEAVHLWGAQLEEGSYPTSYIPTSGSQATRAADVSSSSSGFGNSWYRQDEGTVFVKSERPDASRPNTVVASITDGTSANRIEVRSSSGTNQDARCEIIALGSGQYSNIALSSNTAYKKIALAYAANNVNAAANGTAGTTDTAASIPVVSQLYFGNDTFLTDYRPGHIKRLTFWPTRLSDETLQGITQQ